MVEPELGHARKQRVFQFGVATRRDAPCGRFTRGIAAEYGTHHPTATGLCVVLLLQLFLSGLARLTLSLKYRKYLSERLVKVRELRGYGRRLLTGNVGSLDLLQGPSLGTACARYVLHQVWRRPVAQTRTDTPDGVRWGNSLCLDGCNERAHRQSKYGYRQFEHENLDKTMVGGYSLGLLKRGLATNAWSVSVCRNAMRSAFS